MSLDGPDPVLEQLMGLPLPAEDPQRIVGVRQRCHALMARRAALEARVTEPAQTGWRASDAIALLAASLYLATAVAETWHVIGAR